MKKILIPLLLVIAAPAWTQNYSVDMDEKKADRLLHTIKSGQGTHEDSTSLQTMASAFQNSGQRLDETNHDYKKALDHIEKAIALYDGLGDTLNIAFNKKYKGHLLVRLGKIPQAKIEIRTAINLYRAANTGAGVASSQFDLARVFEFENKTDSAIYYAGASRDYWKQQQNNLQLLLINNMMVYHLLQLNQTEKAEAVYHESELLLQKQPAHWQPLLDYYFTSMLLFRQINDIHNSSHYRVLYLQRVEALRREGIAAKSYYETFAQ